MKVSIGPYPRHVSAYSFLEKFEKHLGETRVDKAYDAIQPVLNATINKVFDRPRKVKIRIDDYDVWEASETLALVIAPVLVRLKEKKQGAPHIDDEDVPVNLRSTAVPLSEDAKKKGDLDEMYFKRWEYVLDEMIWAFEQASSDDWENQFSSGEIDLLHVKVDPLDSESLYSIKRGPNDTHKFDREGCDAHLARMNNGYLLFGKYFLSLWD